MPSIRPIAGPGPSPYAVPVSANHMAPSEPRTIEWGSALMPLEYSSKVMAPAVPDSVSRAAMVTSSSRGVRRICP